MLSKYAAARLRALTSLLVFGSCLSELTERNNCSSPIVPGPGPSRAGFYVTPTGSPTGDGSASCPWDLATALSGGRGRVQPGDTIWLRGGTYSGTFTGNLNGTAAKPIIVRQYPGERATLLATGGKYTTTLRLYGSYTWYWGFEVVGSPTSIGYCLDPRGTNNKVINVVAHDILGFGIGAGLEGQGIEIYGTIVYNIGPMPAGEAFPGGYGIYIGNSLTSPTKTVRDNMFFNTTGYGITAYNQHGHAHNMTFEGNVLFNTGLVRRDPDILLLATGSTNITFANNYTYGNRHGRAASFNDGASGRSITVTGNFFHGTTVFGPFTTATVANNTFYAAGPSAIGDVLVTRGSTAGWTWGTNTHYRSAAATAWRHDAGNFTLAGWKSATGRGATDANPDTAPTGTQVIVRPNVYEAGRAHIIIYNWAQAANASVDLSGVLSVGQAYTIVNAQNFYGAPVASGVYAGGTVSLPMAPVRPPALLYASFYRPVTGPTFQVFVVRLQGS